MPREEMMEEKDKLVSLRFYDDIRDRLSQSSLTSEESYWYDDGEGMSQMNRGDDVSNPVFLPGLEADGPESFKDFETFELRHISCFLSMSSLFDSSDASIGEQHSVVEAAYAAVLAVHVLNSLQSDGKTSQRSAFPRIPLESTRTSGKDPSLYCQRDVRFTIDFVDIPSDPIEASKAYIFDVARRPRQSSSILVVKTPISTAVFANTTYDDEGPSLNQRDATSNRLNSLPRPTAIVEFGPNDHRPESPSSLATSKNLASLSNVFPVPIVSHATLGDFDNLSRFPNFWRLSPSERSKARAIAEYMTVRLQVKHCAVLYVKNNFQSVSLFRALLTVSREVYPPLKLFPVAIATDGKNASNNDTSYGEAINDLKLTEMRYFVGMIDFKLIKEFMPEAFQQGCAGPGTFWMFPLERIPYTPNFDGDVLGLELVFPEPVRISPQLEGALLGTSFADFAVLRDKMNTYDSFIRLWNETRWQNGTLTYLQNKLTTTTNIQNVLLAEETSDFQWSPDSISNTPSRQALRIYESIVAIGTGCCRRSLWGGDFRQSFLETSFVGPTGVVSVDSRTGSRKDGTLPLVLFNVQQEEQHGAPNHNDDNNTHHAHSRSKLVLRVTDSYSMDSLISQRPSWTRMTDATFYFADGSEIPPYPYTRIAVLDDHLLSRTEQSIGSAIASFLILFSGALIVWTIHYRKTAELRRGQVQFLIMMCLGAGAVGVSVILITLQEPRPQRMLDMACMSSAWIYILGTAVIVLSLFARLLRVNRIYVTGEYSCSVRTRAVFFPFGFCLSVYVILLTSWTIGGPLKYRRVVLQSDHFGRELETYPTCIPGDIQIRQYVFWIIIPIWQAISLLLLLVEAYRARHILLEYSENVYTGMGVGGLLQAATLSVPSIVLLPQKRYWLFVIYLTGVVQSMMLPIFFPKLTEVRERNLHGGTSRRSNSIRSAAFSSSVPRSTMSERLEPRRSSSSVTILHQSITTSSCH